MAKSNEEIVPRRTTEAKKYRIAKGVSNVFLGGQVYHKSKDANTLFAENEEVLARFKDGHLEVAE